MLLLCLYCLAVSRCSLVFCFSAKHRALVGACLLYFCFPKQKYLLYFVFLLFQAKILVPLLSVQCITVLTSRSFALLPAKDRCLFCIKESMVTHFQCAISKTNGRFRAWVVCLNMHGCGCTSMCCLFICLFLRDSSGSRLTRHHLCLVEMGNCCCCCCCCSHALASDEKQSTSTKADAHSVSFAQSASEALVSNSTPQPGRLPESEPVMAEESRYMSYSDAERRMVSWQNEKARRTVEKVLGPL